MSAKYYTLMFNVDYKVIGNWRKSNVNIIIDTISKLRQKINWVWIDFVMKLKWNTKWDS